jgi:hypothetical protein
LPSKHRESSLSLVLFECKPHIYNIGYIMPIFFLILHILFLLLPLFLSLSLSHPPDSSIPNKKSKKKEEEFFVR